MNELKFGCPKCERPFRVPPEFSGQVVQCPHCGKKVRVPTASAALVDTPDQPENAPTEAPSASPSTIELGDSISQLPARFEIGSETSFAESEGQPGRSDSESPVNSASSNVALAVSLPPKFEVDDPLRIRSRIGSDSKVLLPTADGGVQTIDNRLVTIEYKGQKYTVVALSPEEKRRRQLIVNIISMIIAIGAIIGTFWLLLG